MRLAAVSPAHDYARPAIAFGLVAVYALAMVLAGGIGGVFGLAVPLAIVGLLWATPLGIAVVNGERGAMVFFTICLILFSIGSFRARGWNDQSLDWQVLLKLAVWVAAGGIALVNIRRILELLRHPHIALCAGFVALLPLSALWAADPLYALSSGMFHLFIMGFAFTLVSRCGERWALIAAAAGAATVVLPSLAISPFMTSLGEVSAGSTGELDRVRGLTGHPVALAMVASQLAICMIFLIERKWVPRLLGWAVLFMAVATVLITQSRMPALAMLAATLLTFLVRKRLFGFATPFVALPVIIVTLGILALGVDHVISEDVLRMVSRSGRPEEILTLSGRSEIWAFVLAHIAEAPVLGFGQGAGPAILLTGFKGWSLVHAHNLFLQVILCLGFAGLALLLLALVVQVQLAIVYQRTFPLLMTSYLCLLGLTEPVFVNNLPDPTFFMWSLSVALTLPPGVAVGDKSPQQKGQAAITKGNALPSLAPSG